VRQPAQSCQLQAEANKVNAITELNDTSSAVDPWADGSRPAIGTWLRTREHGVLATASGPVDDWLFPGGDELFRGIYTRGGIGFANEVIAIFSAIAGEGKTAIGLGLGVTIAQDFPERRVLLVETDLHRPVLAEDFDLEPSPGLMECLVADEPLQSACRTTFLENLHVVPAGGSATVRGRPLRSSRMAALVDAMRQSYDLVILDLPPILANSDAVLLTDLADGAIAVVRAGITPIALINRALEQIEESKLRGIVLNGAGSSIPGWLRRLLGM
jgi:protein-tyrosine kinase